jgi:hypothetical protein
MLRSKTDEKDLLVLLGKWGINIEKCNSHRFYRITT